MDFILDDYKEIQIIAHKIHDDNFNSINENYSLSIYEAYKIAIELFKCQKLTCIDKELEIFNRSIKNIDEVVYLINKKL